MKNRLSTSATIVGPLLAIAVIGAMAWFIWHTVQSAATSQHQPASQGAALSTLTGTVSEGPTKPVCTVGQSCDAVVASHTIQVLDAS